MSDRDIRTLVAISTVIRVNLEVHGVISEDIFGRRSVPPTETLGCYQIHINNITHQFKGIGLPNKQWVHLPAA